MEGHGRITVSAGAGFVPGCGVGTPRDSVDVRTILREPRMRRRTHPAPPSAPTPSAVDDARALALELGGLRPFPSIDPSALGVVIEPGEAALRSVGVWLRWLVDGEWSAAQHCVALVTDRRVVARLSNSGLRSFWWGSLVGLEIDLAAGHVVLDYGDGRPRALSGEAAPVIAVAAVAAAYGVEGLATHEAIAPLRS
jgi:hypothetical protein